MRILGYAIAPRDAAMPEQRARRKARLPTVAIELAQLAVGERLVPEDTAVFFGTGYGAATETEAFVENMFALNEEQPKPRQFAASVHNAMASRVAMALGARGPNRTFVQGAMSFWWALHSARGRPLSIVGALDESTPYIRRGRASCGKSEGGEGGAVFLVGEGEGPRVRFSGEAERWIRPSDEHPSSGAAALAEALDGLQGSVGVRITSRFSRRGVIIVERA